MPSFVKFHQFAEDLAHQVHDLSSDTLKLVLTNTAPVAATDEVLTDITEIASTDNGYTAGGAQATISSSEHTSGVYKLTLADVTWTQAGANAIGPFRYIVLYNDTPTSPANPLIGYWDNGVSGSRVSGQTFTTDFSSSTGALTIT